jgi:hypothetical protein
MLLTYKIYLMRCLQWAYAVFLCYSVANHQIPASIRSTLQYKLLQKNENDYNALFILILAHLFPIDLNINYYYAIKNTETIK